VHHYAQNAGSENDQGLLAASAEVDTLMQDVRKQVDELGTPGHRYEIWLSEWNSVDANPGPQILEHINALFIADYLGHLARAPIQVANLWALYNSRDKRLGDYGLLALSGDPQGYNARRPSYWALQMMSNTLTGNLLSGHTDQEELSGWMSKRADGGVGLVFVNKSIETDYQLTLHVSGLRGDATLEVLTDDTSGGLRGADAMGATHASTGPTSKRVHLADGDTLFLPKASIVTVRY
jgi:hypothetical protein